MPRLVIVLCCLLALTGCGPRLEVARDRLIAEADRLLGETDVKRKEIGLAIEQSVATLNRLKKGRVEVQVRASQLSCDLTSTQGKLSQTDRGLARLRDLLAEDRPVEIAGTTHTRAQLRGMAGRMIATRKNLAAQVETLGGTKERLANVVTLMESREQEGRDRLDALKGLVAEIDAKALVLRAIQEAARACEDTGTIDFQALERQVGDLRATIDGELKFHEEMLKQSIADSRSVETILRDTGSTGDLAIEIDRLLGTR